MASAVDSAGTVIDLVSAGANNFIGNSANSATSNRFNDGDQLTLTVTSISNPAVNFDGFAGVGINFGGFDGVGFTGVVTGGTNPGVNTFVSDPGGANTPDDARQGQTPGNTGGIFANGVVLTQIQGPNDVLAGTIRGLNLQFSTHVIPEPASLATIVGLIALPFLSRRRRVVR